MILSGKMKMYKTTYVFYKLDRKWWACFVYLFSRLFAMAGNSDSSCPHKVIERWL